MSWQEASSSFAVRNTKAFPFSFILTLSPWLLWLAWPTESLMVVYELSLGTVSKLTHWDSYLH